METIPVCRKDAKREGAPHYYTGKLCKQGHDSRRQTANGECIQCIRNREKKRRLKEKERLEKWREETNRGLKRVMLTVPENAVDVVIEWANSCLLAVGKPALNRKDS